MTQTITTKPDKRRQAVIWDKGTGKGAEPGPRGSSPLHMMLAQKLYEGVELGEEGRIGLITYMRTDSTRVSDDAQVLTNGWKRAGIAP